jgi:hypothetical protein
MPLKLRRRIAATKRSERECGLADASVYRHAHVLGLVRKRRQNIRAALERMIEKAGEVDVTASAVVAAVQAYAEIIAAGVWIERTETVSINDLFEWMTSRELETYAQTGALPGWFRATAGVSEQCPKLVLTCRKSPVFGNFSSSS